MHSAAFTKRRNDAMTKGKELRNMITEYKHTSNIQQCLWSNTQWNQFIHHMQNIRLTCH